MPRRVRAEHPLKQGLKHAYGIGIGSAESVRAEHPLKQGLKHSSANHVLVYTNGESGTSIKTRIETEEYRQCGIAVNMVRAEHPLKQGLKQELPILGWNNTAK